MATISMAACSVAMFSSCLLGACATPLARPAAPEFPPAGSSLRATDPAPAPPRGDAAPAGGVLAGAIAATNQPWEFGLRARIWRPSPSGDFLITKGGRAGSGTKIDVADDLDLRTGNAPSVQAEVARGPHRGYLTYEPLTWHGSSTLDRAVVFRRVRYPAGDHVRTDLTMNFVTGGYDYAVVDAPESSLRAGLAARVWTFEASLDGSPSGGDTRRVFTHGMPLLTLVGERRFGTWRAAADVAFGVLSSDRLLLDADLCVGVRLAEGLTLDAGYRLWKMRFHETTNRADLGAGGPFLEMELRF